MFQLVYFQHHLMQCEHTENKLVETDPGGRHQNSTVARVIPVTAFSVNVPGLTRNQELSEHITRALAWKALR